MNAKLSKLLRKIYRVRPDAQRTYSQTGPARVVEVGSTPGPINADGSPGLPTIHYGRITAPWVLTAGARRTYKNAKARIRDLNSAQRAHIAAELRAA